MLRRAPLAAHVLTACRNGVVSSTAQVGKAGSKPALPRNCGERRDDAAPSQATDGVDGADWTFAGEGGFRRVLIHLPIACGPVPLIPREKEQPVGNGRIFYRHTCVPVASSEDPHSVFGTAILSA